MFKKTNSIDHMGRAKRGVWFLLAAILLCCGCGQKKGDVFIRPNNKIVWPNPPSEPRIEYVGYLSTEDDLAPKISSVESLRRALFGREKIGVMLSPYAVIMDKNQRLFVSDITGSVIHVMDLDSRQYQQISQTDRDERLLTPIGLAIDGENLYVADSGLGKICVFDLNGRFLYSFGLDCLIRPSGIAYHPKNHLLYVSDSARHSISVFNTDGEHVNEIGARGSGPVQFNFPTHLWIDKSGRLYVSDTLNFRVQILSPEGNFLRAFGHQGDSPGFFAHPCGLASDSFGNIYVVDKQFENIQIFDIKGDLLMSIGQEGSRPGEFWLPAGIYLDNKNRLYVADTYNNRVQVFQLLKGD